MNKRSEPMTLRSVLGTATLQQETVLYILVSTMDLFMTYILLSQDGSVFIESNPIARYFILGWGMKGMVYFKFGTVAFVCVLAQIISRRRPRVARWLLLGATALVAVVVAYSLRLLLVHNTPSIIEVD